MPYEYLHGVDEAIKNLEEFPVKVEQNVTRGAMRAAAMVVYRYAYPLVPEGTGIRHKGASASLRDTLRVTTGVRDGNQVFASVKIGDRRKGVFYAAMVLGGTRSHAIRVRHAVDLVLFTGIFRKSVQHPGARAQPFMDRAIDATRDAAPEAAFDYAGERIRRIIADQP